MYTIYVIYKDRGLGSHLYDCVKHLSSIGLIARPTAEGLSFVQKRNENKYSIKSKFIKILHISNYQ